MSSTQASPLTETPKLPEPPRALRLAVEAALLSLVVFAALYFPERNDTSGAIIGGAAAYVPAALGIAALRRSRVLPRRSGSGMARCAALALLLGVGAGAANLLVNYALAQLDPRVHESMVRKLTVSSHWSMVVTAPVTEELTFRLFALSGIAWLLLRFVKKRERVFPVALIVSSILFGFIHIPYPIPATEAVLMVHTVGVLVKSSAAGLLLGWVFWRWGLPYSMACHGAANGIYIVLAPLLFNITRTSS